MKIGIDFDRVLFDTDAFKDHLFSTFPDFDTTYDRAKQDGVYDPERHARLMGVEPEEIYRELDRADRFLYSDVEVLKEVDHRVVIVTRGDQEFQELKLERSGVLEYVDGYIVVQDAPKGRDVDFLIDDREKEVQRADVPGHVMDRDREGLDEVLRRVGDG
ncbi:MAG: HAD-IA family hydrolase [Candidatus Nanohaloarchaea archaeon]